MTLIAGKVMIGACFGACAILTLTASAPPSNGADGPPPDAIGAFALLPSPSKASPAISSPTTDNALEAQRSAEVMTQELAESIQGLLAQIRPAVIRAGLGSESFDAIATGIRPAPAVLSRLGAQPELTRSVSAYVESLVDETRIAEGRRMILAHKKVLARIEAAYGVPASVVVAIWGIESRYGARKGSLRVLDALATLAAAGERRQAFWRQQLIAAFHIIARGDVSADGLVGSWAGAVGHTQFIPATYLRRAVDFDGDGRRDMIGSVADALASAAHHLKASGWQRDVPWGIEVRLPAGFDYALSTPGRRRAIEFWDQLKVKAVDDGPLPRISGDMQLILPAGADGPAFLVSGNYRAILAYNNAMSYALSVGLLADRIAGVTSVTVAWPRGISPLDRGERMEVQRLLDRLGYGVGGIDGVMGDGTRSAIRAYQAGAGLAEDGHPDRRLLDRLRVDIADAAAIP